MGPMMMTAPGPATAGRSFASADVNPRAVPDQDPAKATPDAVFALDADNDKPIDDTGQAPAGPTLGPATLPIPLPVADQVLRAFFDVQTAQTAEAAPPAAPAPATFRTTAVAAAAAAPTLPEALALPDPSGKAPTPLADASPPSARATADIPAPPADPRTPPAPPRADTPPPAATPATPASPPPDLTATVSATQPAPKGAPLEKVGPAPEPAAPAATTETAPPAPTSHAQRGAAPLAGPTPKSPDLVPSDDMSDGSDLTPAEDSPATGAPQPDLRPGDTSRVPGPRPDPVATPRHLSAQMTSAVRHGHDGTVEIALNPEELGRVRLSLQGDTTRLHVAIQFERPETQDLMRRHIAQLQSDFREMGYTNISFDFGQTPSGGGPDLPAPTDSGADPAPELPPDTAPVPAPRRMAATSPGGLDLRL